MRTGGGGFGDVLCVSRIKKNVVTATEERQSHAYIQSHGVTSETFVFCGEKEGKVFRTQAEFKELRNAVGFKVRLIHVYQATKRFSILRMLCA